VVYDHARLSLAMNRLNYIMTVLFFVAALLGLAQTPLTRDQGENRVQNAYGLQLLVSADNAQPTLRIILPGHETSDRSIEVLFPEHVTAVKHNSSIAEHLYLFRPGAQGEPVKWRRIGPSLEYERLLSRGAHLLARATLEDDGVRFHYQFTNRSAATYDNIYAVTEPRLTSMFHDVRLERTYVHHKDGFDLLASETPGRLTMPLDQWLPAFYLVSFTWPEPARPFEYQADRITYYHKSRAVDVPFIATLSADRKWVVASFSREPGNVWSNPELTCQHVDPHTSLPVGQQATLEVKILVIHGSLDEALQRAIKQRDSLK